MGEIERDQRSRPFSSSRRLRALLPVVAAGVLAIAGSGHFAHKEYLRIEERKLRALEKTSTHARLLERRIDQAASATTLVGAVLEATRSPQTLDVVVERLMSSQGGVSVIQVETSRGVWRSYANSRLGMVLESPSRQEELPRGRLILFGGTSVSAGANGLVLSQMLHSVETNTSRYWGQVAARLSIEDLSQAARLRELDEAGYFHRLLFYPGTAGEAPPLVLSQSSQEPAAAVESPITFPDGGSLVLEIYPKDGLTYDPFLFVELALVAVAAVLLGGFFYVVLQQAEFERPAAEESPDK